MTLKSWCAWLALLTASLLGASTGRAAPAKETFNDVVPKIEATVEPSTAARGQTVTLKLTMELKPGWHTYPTRQVDPEAQSQVNVFEVVDGKDVAAVGGWEDPSGFKAASDSDLNIKELRTYEGTVVWTHRLVVRPEATPGKTKVTVKLTQALACDESHCLPPPRGLVREAELTISDAPPVAKSVDPGPPPPSRSTEPSKGGPAGSGNTTPTGSASDYVDADQAAALRWVMAQLETQKAEPTGSLAFILAGIFWGAVSLVTPCVFPMIPITVSFFLKQSEKKEHRPVTMALVYCGTIVAVLTVAAVLLLSVFRYLSTNPWMNIGLGALFVFFALSLFGMYEIELPSGLARFTSSREGKGGLVGTMFMALTFTIVSFACVAPFLGGFSGTAAQQQLSLLDRVLGGLAFAATFAAPFFVLALFPSLLKKLPRSGSWLNSVKVVMGFMELAAALVFFRSSELVLVPTPSLFTYDLVLGMWIALIFLCGLYLLNVYRLPHDSPLEHLSVPRLLFGFVFLSLGLYLLPALFKTNAEGANQRPRGVIYAWIDSFLLPEAQAKDGQGGLAWSGDLKRAVEEARAQQARHGDRKLVFVDFTGETCKNCRYNEENVFSKPEVKDLFARYNLVQLYTDKVPNAFYPPSVRDRFGSDVRRQRSDAAANLEFQKDAFDTEQLPLYVILEPLPDGKIKVAGTYTEGKINDPAAFTEFLKRPLESAGGARAQAGGR
jgi:thiol:disulfide interchange protein DsbD